MHTFGNLAARIVPPREFMVTGGSIRPEPRTVLLSADENPGAAPALPTDALGAPLAESFSIAVSQAAVHIRHADAAGARYAAGLVAALAEADGGLVECTARDWPSIAVRGVIEGFYGPPWSHEERLHHFAEAGRWRFNRYAFAPKNDPYHRKTWREPYPAAEGARVAELVSAAREAGIEFVYALHPGIDMRLSDEADHAALAAKARSLFELGIRRFALLFDDIPLELRDEADIAAFGSDAAASGRAHGLACARFQSDVLAPLGLDGTLIMCPTDYAGIGASDYRTGLASTLPADVDVWWTGADIVIGTITDADTASASAVYGGHELVLWDNYPVNDFDRSRAFLGPLPGRDAGLYRSGLSGYFSNPMVEYQPSRLALSTIAEWCWNPDAYDPAAAAERALHGVAGVHAEALRPLVAAASSWPPSAPQYPALTALLESELATPGAGGAELERMVAGLRSLGGVVDRVDAGDSDALLGALVGWARAGVATAAVLDAALAAHRGTGTTEAVRLAWDAVAAEKLQLSRAAVRAFVESVAGELPAEPKADWS